MTSLNIVRSDTVKYCPKYIDAHNPLKYIYTYSNKICNIFIFIKYYQNIMIHSSIQIIYDTREQIPHVDKLKQQGYIITPDTMETADYIITDGIQSFHIEVKNGLDLIASKIDGRLEEQLQRLSQYEFSMVAIVGDIHTELQQAWKRFQNDPDYRERMKWLKPFIKSLPKSLENLLTSVYTRKYAGGHRVIVQQFANADKLQNSMIYIATKMEENKLYYSNDIRVSLTDIDVKDRIKAKRIAMLTSVDGIGIGKAKAIAKHFNYSLKAIIDATDEELMEVHGVKNKLAQNIREELIRELTLIDEVEDPNRVENEDDIISSDLAEVL